MFCFLRDGFPRQDLSCHLPLNRHLSFFPTTSPPLPWTDSGRSHAESGIPRTGLGTGTPIACVSMGHKPIVIMLKSIEWRCSSHGGNDTFRRSQSLQPSRFPIVWDGLCVTLPLACIQEGPMWEVLILAISFCPLKGEKNKTVHFHCNLPSEWMDWMLTRDCPQDVVSPQTPELVPVFHDALPYHHRQVFQQ